MKNKYKFSAAEAAKISKHGIDLTIYPSDNPLSTVCRVSVKEGHFQEFYDVESSFTYSILSGKGTFYLNGEPVEAEAGDLIYIPPSTKIYYFGTMKMVLTCAPAWKEENERHVRFIDKKESPYYKA